MWCGHVVVVGVALATIRQTNPTPKLLGRKVRTGGRSCGDAALDADTADPARMLPIEDELRLSLAPTYERFLQNVRSTARDERWRVR
jgi:hypothetical protein